MSHDLDVVWSIFLQALFKVDSVFSVHPTAIEYYFKRAPILSQIAYCGPPVSQRVNSWRSENEGSGPHPARSKTSSSTGWWREWSNCNKRNLIKGRTIRSMRRHGKRIERWPREDHGPQGFQSKGLFRLLFSCGRNNRSHLFFEAEKRHLRHT